MPAVSSCPKCDAQVSLPPAGDPSWQVRCPLCQEEFPLAEALAKAPPELMVLDRSTAPRADATQLAQSPWANWQSAAADAEPTLVESGFEPAIDLGSTAPAADNSAVPVAEPTLAGVEGGSSSGVVSVPDVAFPELPLRDRSGRGRAWIGRTTGVVLGGGIGLVLGYVALLWLGGPSRDFLQLGPRLPAFMVPAGVRTGVADLAAVPYRVATGPGKYPAPARANARRRVPAAQSETSEISTLGSSRGDDPPAASDDRPPSAAAPAADGVANGRRAQALSIGQFDRALAAARAARDALAHSGPADTQVGQGKQGAYQKFCRLAEALTLLAPDADAVQVERCRDEAGKLVQELTTTEELREALALIAEDWLASPERTGTGILLVGLVQDVQRWGNLHTAQMTLAGRRTVAVLSRSLVALNTGDQAIVLGSIVADPAENLAAPLGNESTVVWAGLVQKVSALVGADRVE